MASSAKVYLKNSAGYNDDEWDDSVLIAAYDKAMAEIRDISRKTPSSILNGVSKFAPVNRGMPKKFTKLKVGDFCQAIFSEDGLLYEAQILDINEGTDRCIVQFLGYGNEEEVKMSETKRSRGKPVREKQIEAASNPSVHQWEVGDTCRALYEDGLMYNATILEIYEDSGSCLVKYLDYDGEEEEIHLKDLEPIGRKMSAGDTESKMSFPENMLVTDEISSTCSSDPSSLSTFEGKCCEQRKGCSSRKAEASCSSRANSSRAQSSLPPPPLSMCEVPFLPNEHLPFPGNGEVTDSGDDLTSMMISWYMAGYHTGYYQGRHSRVSTRNMETREANRRHKSHRR